MIYDFNDYNFHVWFVFFLTLFLIGLNLIIPKFKLKKLKTLQENDKD